MDDSIQTLYNSIDFQEQKKLLHFRALRSSMGISDPPPGKLLHNRLLSSAQALQMSGIELLEQRNIEDGKIALKEASELYEYLATLDIYSLEIQTELLLLAAITASLSDYQANAYVLSNNLPKELNELTQKLRDSYSAFSILAILLLRRRIGEAKSFISEEESRLPLREQTLINRMQSLSDEYPTSDPIMDGWRFLCLKHFLRACNFFIKYLEIGDNEAYEQAISTLNHILDIFLREGDVEYWYIVHALHALMLQIRERSIWVNIYAKLNTPLIYQYCYNLASTMHPKRNGESLFELWPSQITAINKGLLEAASDNVIIRLPTSAGKTRIAEMTILASLNHHPEQLCIYIAPYRALVEDVRAAFNISFTPLGFRVVSVLGGTEYIEDETQLAKSFNILVVTPEKFDLVLRRWPDILHQTGVVIFDEGHIIAEEKRGLRSEFLLSRILRQSKKYNFRVVFMSAMIPNLEDLQALLEVSPQHTISGDWRPNRQMIGHFHWFNSQNKKDNEGKYGRVIYSTEIWIPKVIVRQEYPVPGKIYQLNLFDPHFEPEIVEYPKSLSDTQAALALRYERLGPVLIFSATKPKAKSVCKSIDQGLLLTKAPLIRDFEHRSALEKLATEIRRFLGQHELIEYIRQGFALHHSDLPESVRLLIEEGFRQEHLRILVATTTLAQGINLPIKTVIVGGLRRGQDDYVPVRDYKNIIGRAGRANHETEGNIILCHEKLPQAIAYSYSNLSPVVEDIRSRLWYLWEQLIKDRVNVNIQHRTGFLDTVKAEYLLIPVESTEGDDLHPIDTELFTILTEEAFDADDEEALFNVLSNTLFAHQCHSLQVDYRPFAAYLSARYRIVKAKYLEPGLQTVYYQTGLPLQSCNRIVQIIKEENPNCIERLFSGQIDDQLISELVKIALRCQAIKFKEKDSKLLLSVLPDWLQGKDIGDIVKNISDEYPNTTAEKVCEIAYTHISKSLSWIVSGIIHLTIGLVANTRSESIEATELSLPQLIPAFLKYGVNTRSAVRACLLGIEDRLAAIQLGQEYDERRGSVRFEAFSNWLLNLNFPELLAIVKDKNKALRILTEEISISRQDAKQKEFLQTGLKEIFITAHVWRNPYFIGTIAQIVVKHCTDNPDPFNMAVFTEDNRLIGYIARNTSIWLSQLPNNLTISESTFDKDQDIVTVHIKRLD